MTIISMGLDDFHRTDGFFLFFIII